MANTPHSDKSGRAARRREEREVAKAQNTVARAQARPVEGSPNITVNDLLRKIGALTVERDAMQLQINQQQAQIEALYEALPDAKAPEDAPEEDPNDGPPTGRTGE
jgi:hypothetical protein